MRECNFNTAEKTSGYYAGREVLFIMRAQQALRFWSGLADHLCWLRTMNYNKYTIREERSY